jgi:phage terminase large subunit GpA-like protein
MAGNKLKLKARRPGSRANPFDESGDDPETIEEAERRKMIANADKAEVQVAKEAGILVPISEVMSVVSEEHARVRARLLTIPNELRPAVLTFLAEDREAGEQLLAAAEETILEALSEIRSWAPGGERRNWTRSRRPMTPTPTPKTYAVVERIREPQRAALRDAVLRGLARAYMPPPKTSVSEWADNFRFLSPEAAAVPGKWKTSREPMAKGVLDAFSDPMTEKVTAMCAAQILKTEALLNTAGYFIHGDPAPILMVQPTVEMAEAFSKDRVAPMIRDTPVLKEIFTSKSRDSGDTILQKAFPGGRLNMTGANAPATLASRPIRIVLCDEVDRFPASAGTEGDPVSLAEKRTTTFWNRKIGLVSTPTIKGESRIEASYEEGDQRKFFVPCPHCGVRQELTWKGVKWAKDEEGVHDPDTAHYECQADTADPETGEFGCGQPWTESQRLAAITEAGKLPGGGWIATKPFKGHASFRASQISSKRVPLHRIVKEFLEAKPYPDRLKTWTNTVLAETWEDGGEKVDPKTLYGRREDYTPDMLPAGVGMVTAAADIQDNRFEVEICGWGANEERWSIDYIVHHADPSTPDYWAALDDVLLRTFRTPPAPRSK